MSNSVPTRILILGGGFAGLYAAMELEKTLARDPELEITLINPENFFLFTPMLHEVAASDLDITAIVNPVRKSSSEYASSKARSSPSIFPAGKWLSLTDSKTTITSSHTITL